MSNINTITKPKHLIWITKHEVFCFTEIAKIYIWFALTPCVHLLPRYIMFYHGSRIYSAVVKYKARQVLKKNIIYKIQTWCYHKQDIYWYLTMQCLNPILAKKKPVKTVGFYEMGIIGSYRYGNNDMDSSLYTCYLKCIPLTSWSWFWHQLGPIVLTVPFIAFQCFHTNCISRYHRKLNLPKQFVEIHLFIYFYPTSALQTK